MSAQKANFCHLVNETYHEYLNTTHQTILNYIFGFGGNGITYDMDANGLTVIIVHYRRSIN